MDLRDSGKLYVVILVIMLIFAGLALFLFNMETRIKKLEKAVNASRRVSIWTSIMKYIKKN